MKVLAVILALCVGTSSAISCADLHPGKNAMCLASCEGFGVPSYQALAIYACAGTKCCVEEEQTTTTTTTTVAPTTVPTSTSTAVPTTTVAPTTVPTSTSTTVPTTTTPEPAPPVEQQCGVQPEDVTFRILGGSPSKKCDWPWQVSIRGRSGEDVELDPSSSNSVPFCNGVIIDENHVVTTAACVILATAFASGPAEDNILVIAGEYDTQSADFTKVGDAFTPNEVGKGVSKVTIHPEYFKTDASTFTSGDLASETDETEANNLAILKLISPLEFGRCIRKACKSDELSWNTKDCVIAGWGTYSEGLGAELTTKLLTAEVELIKPEIWNLVNKLCDDSDTLIIKPLTTFAIFKDSAINGSTCMSDNGGMVVCKNGEGGWALEGLINRPSFDACSPGDRFLVTDISAAQMWINNVTMV
ncbi:serine proteinase stubble [Patella vulgata]|uniref:serine proteinase stubble n=1 Tax=Patella vulgata TaxID=6465 RepID=UPI00217F8032|nr:serine proteinase stubble [Patella vulgata]